MATTRIDINEIDSSIHSLYLSVMRFVASEICRRRYGYSSACGNHRALGCAIASLRFQGHSMGHCCSCTKGGQHWPPDGILREIDSEYPSHGCRSIKSVDGRRDSSGYNSGAREYPWD